MNMRIANIFLISQITTVASTRTGSDVVNTKCTGWSISGITKLETKNNPAVPKFSSFRT
ncbi:hypothetical protein KC19_10G136100 [Ceratodon purpureus]|uniref:Uncharacterized protein n=1 Tax=Ceratodon purpureus TaxID=3225 RepID=A0A8T0GMS2_CERPU|nr:hypothetical protein KC19_10G136100 [Ceratodon purpureus]